MSNNKDFILKVSCNYLIHIKKVFIKKKMGIPLLCILLFCLIRFIIKGKFSNYKINSKIEVFVFLGFCIL